MASQGVTLGHITRRNASLFPDRLCIACGDEQFTFDQFNRRVNRLANALAGLGVTREDRVAYLNFNCHRSVEIKFALGKLGAVEVPLNFRLVGEEIVYIVNDAEAKVFLLGAEFRELVESVGSRLETVRHYVAVGGGGGMLDWEEFAGAASDREPGVDVDEDDVVIQMYTSGTTGKPKGCMLTHRNIIEAAYGMNSEWNLTEKDFMVAAQPIFHIATAGIMFATLYAGGSSVILRSFNPVQFLEFIQKYRATFTGLLPQAARVVLLHPDLKKYDLSSLRFFVTAYEPDLIKKAGELLGCSIMEYYGSTETTANVTFHNHTATGFQKLTSCGRPARNVEVKIVDDDDNELPTGQVGEIVVRGASNMKGYWKLPGPTAETLRGGWLHTGDMGYLDEDRYLYIKDRKKDMIRTGGENVYCKEVEDVIYTHPAVYEAAVIGVPDERWGETVKAVVALKEGASATAGEIIEHCKKYLASYKKPTSVDFVKALPRNSSGKVVKVALREQYWAGYDRRIN
ncbi:MAG: long-chain-fatty-acid--CoA ligase [Bacillota bacterium]